ncbi:tripeptide aminopeptidase [Elusimicrobium simillimum]|uniref:peptidase T n=1 Tax=Elusimicrobium simillimum TaxID=3143438 RepID=UPI003C6FC8D2
MNIKQAILDRFLSYVKVETTSDDNSQTVPSTPTQYAFAKTLEQEMKNIGVENVILTDKGYLMGIVPSNIEEHVPAIGFIAHMDTYHEFNGKDVTPIVHKNYDGKKIPLKNKVTIDPASDKQLLQCIGDTIITTDGTTVLGGDDKSGIAIIMTLAEYLIKNPGIKHGKICIGFTPDEEIGRGSDHFDVKAFGADFAYTVDGDAFDSVENGNFNGDGFTIKITGVSCHPGSAKDVMVNPVRVAADIISSWPTSKLPETTDGTDGFIFFTTIKGSIESAEVHGAVREHSIDKLHMLEDTLRQIVEDKKKFYKNANIELTIKDQYRNMKDVILEHPQAMEKLADALKELGFKYTVRQVRGGTDGARLSFMGLPTPNIFAGYSQPHGPYEWASLEYMEKAFKVIKTIAEVK